MQIYELFATPATSTSIGISYQLKQTRWEIKFTPFITPSSTPPKGKTATSAPPPSLPYTSRQVSGEHPTLLYSLLRASMGQKRQRPSATREAEGRCDTGGKALQTEAVTDTPHDRILLVLQRAFPATFRPRLIS